MAADESGAARHLSAWRKNPPLVASRQVVSLREAARPARSNQTLSHDAFQATFWLLSSRSHEPLVNGMNRIRPCWAPCRGPRSHASRSSSTCWRASLLAKTFCWFSTMPPTTAAATLPFPTTSCSYISRRIRLSSIRRKTCGMKSVKKSSKPMRSNLWTPHGEICDA